MQEFSVRFVQDFFRNSEVHPEVTNLGNNSWRSPETQEKKSRKESLDVSEGISEFS